MFIMVPETDIGPCEWDTFVGGDACWADATNSIIDTSDKGDPSYPEGFHWAHGCNSHAPRMLFIATGV